MNPNKICFITCVNDDVMYEECLRYIHALEVPDHMELETIRVTDATSMTAGYNHAMQSSDAKYKVYLHQDVFVIHRTLISELISVFERHPELGLIGLVGTDRIPVNGIWWDSPSKWGRVYESHTGKMEELRFQDVQDDYQQVMALDGFFLATQYDVEWKESLFNGWHFYDLSQCMEFIANGYSVGVIRQWSPWSIHDCGIVNVRNQFDEYRKIFLEKYGNRLFPKVSILIPTYNRPHYFEFALQSALNQTYPHIEIVVCDDSTNHDTETVIQPYLREFPNIRYYKNEKNLGQFQNDLLCMKLATGEYINFLMDDDLFHPQKIEKMMSYFVNDTRNEITLVTSHRQLIDANGNFLTDFPSTRRLFEQDTMMEGKVIAEYILHNLINVIGEPTTVLFRKNDLDEPFGMFGGREYLCNVDLATWFQLLNKGKMIYISESLSYFRIHSDQQLHSGKMLINGTIDFAHLIMESRHKGIIMNDRNNERILQRWKRYSDSLLAEMLDSGHLDRIKELKKYTEWIEHEYRQIVNPKLELIQKAFENQYHAEEENVIIFLVPGENGITGGILSIYSIFEETRKLKGEHGHATIMCSLPKDSILVKNTNFDNDVIVYPLEFALDHFPHLRKCVIHLPECYVEYFMTNISIEHKFKLQSLDQFHLNILIQNIEMAPTREKIAELYKFTNHVTCTTAHKRYSTREYRDALGIPLHYLSTYGSPEKYKFRKYHEKENILVVSNDPHPMKEQILSRIRHEFPEMKIVIVQGMKYEDYKELISAAKWSLTFGEGLDGYFGEAIFSGSISFAVYNDRFFTHEFADLETVFFSYDHLLTEMASVMRNLDNELSYQTYQQVLFRLVSQLYNFEAYKNNIKKFYRGEYTFH
jgi:glycosyltransferase involved in cell wall biosynthesis